MHDMVDKNGYIVFKLEGKESYRIAKLKTNVLKYFY